MNLLKRIKAWWIARKISKAKKKHLAEIKALAGKDIGEEPILHAEYIFLPAAMWKHKTNRAKRKFAETEMKDISMAVSRKVNQFFDFHKKNRPDLPAVQRELERLNAQWKKYLRERQDVFDYDECQGFFLERINYLLQLHTKLTADQFESIVTAGDEKKV